MAFLLEDVLETPAQWFPEAGEIEENFISEEEVLMTNQESAQPCPRPRSAHETEWVATAAELDMN
jgi:hypothetical protein